MEENNKGTVIAVKSNMFTILEVIGAIIGFGMAIFEMHLYLDTKQTIALIFSIVLFAVGVWALCLTIGNLSKPKVLIEDLGDKIIIYQSGGRQIELRFADIDDFVAKPMRAKRITYKFGNLLIKTQGTTYKVGVIKDVEEVAKKLYSKIAYKYQY